MNQLSSLKNAQKFPDFVDDLRLSSKTNQTENKIFIIVEGNFDAKLYKRFYEKDKYQIHEVAGGCNELEKAVEVLSKESKQFIGIRDADFYHLEGKKPSCELVFLTDTTCAETMCLKSDIVVNNIIIENDLNNEVDEFRSSCLQRIKFIGYARWYNYKNNLGLDFKFINNTNIELAKENFVDKLLKCSPKVEVQKEELIIEIEKLIDEKHNLLQLCNGHDLVSVIYKKINKKTGKGVGGHEIERILRMNYPKEDFEKTNLHKSIMEKLKEFPLT